MNEFDELVDVKIIAKDGLKDLVVEYTDTGQLKRTIVPATVVQDSKAALLDLVSGMPYGEPWEHMVMLRLITPQMYADALRRRGIWTVEDLQAKPAEAMAAIQEVHGVELAHLLTSVRGR